MCGYFLTQYHHSFQDTANGFVRKKVLDAAIGRFAQRHLLPSAVGRMMTATPADVGPQNALRRFALPGMERLRRWHQISREHMSRYLHEVEFRSEIGEADLRGNNRAGHKPRLRSMFSGVNGPLPLKALLA